jgi:hypothetical protein
MELISELNHYDPLLSTLVMIWIIGIVVLALRIGYDVFEELFPTTVPKDATETTHTIESVFEPKKKCKKTCKQCKCSRELTTCSKKLIEGVI